MKKLIAYTTAMSVLLLALLLMGCRNPLLGPSIGPGAGEGSCALRILVPNYDFHTATKGAKAISPDSRVNEIYFDSVKVWESDLSSDWATDTASNGFFYTSWENTIKVPAGTYATVRVDLLDWRGGTVLTSGTASGVTVVPGGVTEVHISLTPPPGMFTALTLGVSATGRSVNRESMVFFSFGATAGTGYDITVTPTLGEPDFYVFDPAGKRPGIEKGYDFAYTADNGNGTTGGVTTLTTYKVLTTGTYYIGVYGWKDYAQFGIVVSVNGAAINRPAAPTPDPLTQVEILVKEAITALQDGDYETALSKFTLAYGLDPKYGPAFAGYNALYLMSTAVNPDIVNLARNKLGLVDYPNTMSELFSGQWMQEMVDAEGYEGLLPRFEGQEAMDGVRAGDSPDGIIDFYERMIAFAQHFITHNNGFNSLADTVLGRLGDRLDFHMQQVLSMPSNLNMRFSWDMAFDDWETEVVSYDPYNGASYRWPVDEHGNPLEIVVGKADLLLLASMLEMLEFLINTAKVYNFDLLDGSGDSILIEYWNTFNPLDGTAPGSYTSETTPFLTEFLTPRDTWAVYLGAAKEAFLDALSYIKNAFYEIKADPPQRAGYFLSSTSTLPAIADNWATYRDIMEFAIKTIDEAVDSISDSEADDIFYFPIDAIGNENFDYYTFGNWPTSIVPGESVGVNLGTLFLNPLAIVLELGADGEPVWYKFNANPAAFSVLTSIEPTAPTPPLAFCKLPDLTLGGIIPVANGDFVPRDDETTRVSLDMEFGDYAPNNGWWDPGEAITNVHVYPAIEGVINFYKNNIDLMYPGGDPVSFYTIDSAAAIPDSELAQYAQPANYGALRTALGAVTNFPGRPEPMFFLYDTQLYISAPAEIAWYSLAAAGTLETDPNGNSIRGTGSIWWWLLNQMYQ